jgi:hypothetical protein
MIEWFLLDRIHLGTRYVSEWHVQFTAPIEPYTANPTPALAQQTAVRAGQAAKSMIFEDFAKAGFYSHLVENG